MELVGAVVAADEDAARGVEAADDLGLQRGGARQRPAVDLEQVGERRRVSAAGSKSLVLASRKRSVFRIRR